MCSAQAKLPISDEFTQIPLLCEHLVFPSRSYFLLLEVPLKVTACGILERLLWIMEPLGMQGIAHKGNIQ
jgi:hypothetical protein